MYRKKIMLIRHSFIFTGLIGLIFLSLLIACSEQTQTQADLRINSLNKSLMCPVCPGESIDQSQNDLAAQMRNVVSKKVYEGKTDQEIKEYFVSKYGPVVLMEPPRKGIGLLAWIFPIILSIFTAFLIFFTLLFLKRNSSKLKNMNNDDNFLTEKEYYILNILRKENISKEDISEILKNSEDN